MCVGKSGKTRITTIKKGEKLEKNTQGQKHLKINSEAGQGPTWTVKPVGTEGERESLISACSNFVSCLSVAHNLIMTTLNIISSHPVTSFVSKMSLRPK